MDQKKDFSQYEDMLYRKRPISHNHPPMDIMDRAAQFSPFAALTGYGDAVKETERITERRQELDEYEKAALDEQLHELEVQMRDVRPQVTITYFVPDEHKEGGAYRTITGNVKKIDYYARRIILENETKEDEMVPVDDIMKLQRGENL